MDKRYIGVLALLVLVAALAACQRGKPERVAIEAPGSQAASEMQFELGQAPAQAVERSEGQSFVVTQDNCAGTAPLETIHRETVALGPAYELGSADGVPDLAPHAGVIGEIVLRRYEVRAEASAEGQVTLRTAAESKSEFVLRWDETWDRNTINVIRAGQVIGSAPVRVRLGTQLVIVSAREEPCAAPTSGTPGKAHLPIVGSMPITTTETAAALPSATEEGAASPTAEGLAEAPSATTAAAETATSIPEPSLTAATGATALSASSPTRTPRPTGTPRPTRMSGARLTATPSATATLADTPTRTRRPTSTIRPTRTLRPSATPRPSRTPTPSRTPRPSLTPTVRPTRTATASRTFTPWPTFTPTRLSAAAPTATMAPLQAASPAPTEIAEPSATPDASLSGPGSEEAIALVRDYIQFLQARQWREAYNLLDESYQRRMSYESFARGYEGVSAIELYGLESTWVDEQRESVRALMVIRTVAGSGDWMGTYEVIRAPGKLPYERRISSASLRRLPAEGEARLGGGTVATARSTAGL